MSCADINCDEMIQGQAYTFRFKYGGILGTQVSNDDLQKGIAADSNFGSPVVSQSCNGIFKANVVSVTFVYRGQGSIVGQAGQEMQNVINNFWVSGAGTSFIFDGATVGICLCCKCTADGGKSMLIWLGIALIIGYVAVQYIGFEKLKGVLRK